MMTAEQPKHVKIIKPTTETLVDQLEKDFILLEDFYANPAKWIDIHGSEQAYQDAIQTTSDRIDRLKNALTKDNRHEVLRVQQAPD